MVERLKTVDANHISHNNFGIEAWCELDTRADTGVINTTTTTPVSGRVATETRPVNISLPYIIRCL